MSSIRQLSRASHSLRAFSTTPARPLAKMQIIGRLADAPEEQDTSVGRTVVRYALGVNTGPRDAEGNRPTSWFKVASFAEGRQKELLLSLTKGTQLYVEAEAKMDSYEVDGQKRSALNLLQRNFEIISARPQNREDSITGAESDTNAVEEPLSGVGAS